MQSALSSGNKINSALDGPCAFFQAKGLTDRSAPLNNLKTAVRPPQNADQLDTPVATGTAVINIQTQNNLSPSESACMLLVRDGMGNLVGAANIGMLPGADQLGMDSGAGNGQTGGDSPFSNSGGNAPTVQEIELNMEGANLYVVQCKQQLGAQTLVMANQSQQVLQSLFRAPAFDIQDPLSSLTAPDHAQTPLWQISSLTQLVIATNLLQQNINNSTGVFAFAQAAYVTDPIFVINNFSVSGNSRIINNSNAETVVRKVSGNGGTLTVSGTGPTSIESVNGTLTVSNTGRSSRRNCESEPVSNKRQRQLQPDYKFNRPYNKFYNHRASINEP